MSEHLVPQTKVVTRKSGTVFMQTFWTKDHLSSLVSGAAERLTGSVADGSTFQESLRELLNDRYKEGKRRFVELDKRSYAKVPQYSSMTTAVIDEANETYITARDLVVGTVVTTKFAAKAAVWAFASACYGIQQTIDLIEGRKGAGAKVFSRVGDEANEIASVSTTHRGGASKKTHVIAGDQGERDNGADPMGVSVEDIADVSPDAYAFMVEDFAESDPLTQEDVCNGEAEDFAQRFSSRNPEFFSAFASPHMADVAIRDARRFSQQFFHISNGDYDLSMSRHKSDGFPFREEDVQYMTRRQGDAVVSFGYIVDEDGYKWRVTDEYSLKESSPADANPENGARAEVAVRVIARNIRESYAATHGGKVAPENPFIGWEETKESFWRITDRLMRGRAPIRRQKEKEAQERAEQRAARKKARKEYNEAMARYEAGVDAAPPVHPDSQRRTRRR